MCVYLNICPYLTYSFLFMLFYACIYIYIYVKYRYLFLKKMSCNKKKVNPYFGSGHIIGWDGQH